MPSAGLSLISLGVRSYLDTCFVQNFEILIFLMVCKIYFIFYNLNQPYVPNSYQILPMFFNYIKAYLVETQWPGKTSFLAILNYHPHPAFL